MASSAVDLAARPASTLTKSEARKLTASIQRQLGDVQARSERLVEAVQRAYTENAWAALGYASWGDYLAHEFPDLSRGQKYRLVAWTEIAGELGAAAEVVSTRDAPKVRRAGASAVGEKVREHLAGNPDPTPKERREAVAAALAEPIEANGTKVEPGDEAALVAGLEAEDQRERAALSAAAEARLPAPPEAAKAARARATAAELIDQLRSIEPDEAAASVELTHLDALNAWIGITRAAVRRRATSAPATAAAPARRGEDVKASDCKHPPTRILGGVCMACGTKVGK